MGTLNDKIHYLQDTKDDIKDAIVAQGISVASTDTFRSYADKISQIQGGGAVYTAGNNVQIENNVISATDTTYTAGDGIEISASNIISTNTLAKASGSDINTGTDDTKYITSKAVTDSKISITDHTETLTNKAIVKRVVTTTDDATAVIDVGVTDIYELSAIANATTFSTTGSPTDGQKLMIRFKDAGAAKALTWDAVFVAIGVTAPTTTVAGKWHYVGCEYNAAATKWHILAVAVQA